MTEAPTPAAEPGPDSDAPPEPDLGGGDAVLWMIGLVLLSGTLLGGWMLYGRAQLAAAAERFEPTQGEVTASALHERGGSSYVSGAIEVAYEVDGESFTLRSNGKDGRTEPFQHAEQLVARYPVGETVVVYHDPSAPEVASLTTKVSLARELMYTILGAALSVAYLGFLWWRRCDASGP